MKIIIRAEAEFYSPKVIDEQATMNIGELKKYLDQYEDDTPIILQNGMAAFSALTTTKISEYYEED